MRFVAVILAVFSLVGCNRDPNVAKKRYLESGNKYFARGKYREARIMYRNALQKDKRYGPAYYHLALTEMKLGQVPLAIGEFQRAVGLLRADQPDHTDAQIRLAELYLAFAPSKENLGDVDGTAKELLKKDPNSYDGHRLTAELLFVKAQQAYQSGDKDQAQSLLQSSIAEFRQADSIKPGQVEIMARLGGSLLADGKYTEAEQIYRKLIDKDKTLTLPYVELYNLYMLQNKPSDAENILKTAITNNPKRYDFLTLLARHYLMTNRRDDMVKVLNQIKSHAKDYPQAYLTVGDFYLRAGNGDQAIREYREGMAAESKQKATYQKRIIEVLMREGKKDEAAQINSEILKDNPKDNDARGLQATLLLDKGDVQKAMTELQTVVTSAPNNFVARYNLGRAHVARGEFEQARQQFQQAIQLRPDYFPARLALAQLQVNLREFDSAVKSTNAILSIDRKNVAAAIVQSAALMGLNKPDDARQVLEQLSKTVPNSPDLFFQLGRVDLSQKRFKEAEDAFRKVYQLNPTSARGLAGVAEVYMAQNQSDRAIQLVQSELQKSPNRADLHIALANIAARTNKFPLAISEYQKALANGGWTPQQSAALYLRIGEAYRHTSDLSDSLTSLQKAHQLDPDNSMIVTSLALSLDEAGRKSDAKKAYEQALQVDPRNAVALNNLAFLIAENGGDLDQALTYAQRAKQIMPDLAEVSDTLGWIYLKKNLSDDAIQVFQDLIAKKPDNPTFHYHLAMAFSQKGDRLSAVQQLQIALKHNPSANEAAKIKELLKRLG